MDFSFFVVLSQEIVIFSLSTFSQSSQVRNQILSETNESQMVLFVNFSLLGIYFITICDLFIVSFVLFRM